MVSLTPLVLAGHGLGDGVFQTDWQAAHKTWLWSGIPDRREWRKSWRANQTHVLTYHLVLAALAALVLPDWRLAVLVGISWVTHSIIDRRWPVLWIMAKTQSREWSRSQWGPVFVDQVLHLAVLFITVAFLAI